MARPTNTKKDRIPIKEDEFNRIIFLAKRDKTLKGNTKKKLIRGFTFLYVTGARVSEIVDFTLDDLQFIYKYKYMILTHTKSNATQRLQFNDKTCDILKDIEYNDCTNYLFYKNNSDEPMAVAGFTKLINKYLAKYLSVLYTTHSFRAGYITRIIEQTGNPKIAQKLARHRDIQTTLDYVGVSDKDIDEAINKIF
jgi:integrase